MSLPIFGAQAAVSILNRVFANTSPANAVFANQVANATASLPAGANSTDVLSYTAFAKSFGTAYATQTPAALSTLMLTNMGLLPNAALATALTDYITAAGVGNVGIVALQLSSILSGIATSDVNYGAAARAWDAEVTSAFTYSSNTANTTPVVGDVTPPPANQGQTFTLTTSVDNIAGTSGDDTVNATNTATSAVLGGLDSIDGSTGNDTLNITDTSIAGTAAFTLPTGFTVKNVETLNVVANGALGDNGTSTFDVSGMTGLTSFKGTSAGDGTKNHAVKAAGTTDVALTVSAGTTLVNGGKTVSITGGGAATVNDAAGTNTGTTLTSVSLTKVNANSTLTGGGITTVTLAGATSATRTITVDNATAAHALTINVNGTGIDSASTTSAFLAGGTKVTDTVATAATINATSTKSSIDLSGSSALKSITITGDAALTLAAAPAAAVTSIDGSAATGKLTLGTLNAAVVTLKTGSAADTATLAATAKVTVDTGAGNDVLSIATGVAVAAGSTINLGAGDDVILGDTVAAASTPTLTTTIDAGEGTDSLASTLINAGNAAQFKNFERISIGNATVDASLMTGSTITGVSIDSNTGTGVLTGMTQAQTLYVNATNAGTSSTLTFTGVAGTTDTYAVKFQASTSGTTATPSTVDAKIVSIEGIETVSIDSGAAAGVNKNVIVLKDAAAKALTVTGSQALEVSFNTAFGTAGATTGVATIDASAATGGVKVDLANVNAAATGITLTGGTGKDNFIAQATTTQTFSGGAGADTFDVSLAVGTAPIVTITDLTAGDKIDLAGTIAAAGTLGAKKDVGAAISIATALDIANGATAASANDALVWFQYGGNTYVYADIVAGGNLGTVDATDNIVKINGIVDLSASTFTTAALLTIV